MKHLEHLSHEDKVRLLLEDPEKFYGKSGNIVSRAINAFLRWVS